MVNPGKTLPGDEVHLYFTRPDQVCGRPLTGRFRALLSDDELARMHRFPLARKRRQYLVARALLRTSLSRYCAVDPADWRFAENAYGKPEISHPAAAPPIHFNLSHADGLTVCAIMRDHSVGVDVEDCRRITRAGLLDLGGHYFSPREAAALGTVPEEQRASRFFDYWTLKESYIKARGAGFAIPLDKFSFEIAADGMKGFSVDAELHDEADCWQFRRMSHAGRYRIALAVRSAGPAVRVKAVESVPLQDDAPIALRFH